MRARITRAGPGGEPGTPSGPVRSVSVYAKKKPDVEYPPYVTVPRKPGEPRAKGQPPRTTRSKSAPADQPVKRIGFRAPKE
ncbi:hypothetical protein ACFWAD_29700 [Rhodococcus sp. NPDC059969]|uniref:hypothetical protein n=1 Tax=Rhodococcus sp. NPDC059969 TaxID=3347018 RepID=UPI00366BFEA0